MSNKNRCLKFSILLLISVISLSFAGSVSAKDLRRAIVFGGNCEEPDAFDVFTRPVAKGGNSFRNGMAELAKSLRALGWQVKPLYADKIGRCTSPSTSNRCKGLFKAKECCPNEVEPERWNSEAIAKAVGLNSANEVPFASKANLFNALDAAAIELGTGDEVLLTIDTHGHLDKKTNRHEICMAGRKKLATNDPVLRSKVARIKQKGIKVAVVDGSCFGGVSVKDLGDLACVLTSQDAISPAQGLFTLDINENDLKKKNSVDEASKYVREAKPTGSVGGATSALLKLLTADEEFIQKILLDNNHSLTLEEVFLYAQIYDRLRIGIINFPQFSTFNEPDVWGLITTLLYDDSAQDLRGQWLGLEASKQSPTEWMQSLDALSEIYKSIDRAEINPNSAREKLLAYKTPLANEKYIESLVEQSRGFSDENVLRPNELSEKIEDGVNAIKAVVSKFESEVKESRDIEQELSQFNINYDVRFSLAALEEAGIDTSKLRESEDARWGLTYTLATFIMKQDEKRGGRSDRAYFKQMRNPELRYGAFVFHRDAFTNIAITNLDDIYIYGIPFKQKVSSKEEKKLFADLIKRVEVPAWEQNVPSESARKRITELRTRLNEIYYKHYFPGRGGRFGSRLVAVGKPLAELLAQGRFYSYLGYRQAAMRDEKDSRFHDCRKFSLR